MPDHLERVHPFVLAALLRDGLDDAHDNYRNGCDSRDDESGIVGDLCGSGEEHIPFFVPEGGMEGPACCTDIRKDAV